MSNITGEEGSLSSGEVQQLHQEQQPVHDHSHGAAAKNISQQMPASAKKKRNLPGTPDPTAEVIALSPTTLMATNRFVCEICNKGFQRDQNLQLHRRGHNLPWKLKQRTTTEVRKRVYICPETTLQSDWKAHQKTCGTREYKCDCGTIFSRRDSFITHRAFCDALAEENNKVNQGLMQSMGSNLQPQMSHDLNNNASMGLMSDFNNYDQKNQLKSMSQDMQFKPMNIATGMFSSNSGSLFGGPRNNVQSSSSGLQLSSNSPSSFSYIQDNKNGPSNLLSAANMSATALLQKAAQMGATASNNTISSPMIQKTFGNTGPMMENASASFENVTTKPDETSFVGLTGGAFSTQLMQKAPHQMFGTGPGSSPSMTDMAMFGDMLMGNDQGFMKHMEHLEDGIGQGPIGPSRFGGSHGSSRANDTLTVDFLGLGGGSRPHNLHEQQQQQRMQMMNPFQQQLEKPIWDV
ncbi:Protein indeterminate-domain 2 [Heracleum sosnowskyi]|uniref:Protein indeterminate-domain 2 n=1 Tax=Heracleum sosnowskyi TaxID=360622 RepID=A0AAD8IFY6_9APIA|nr:Protein indeterminate-domain 2 [Heracleum sosnowskyi]